MTFSHGWMSDTHPEALRAYLKANRNLLPQRKFDRVVGMCDGMARMYTAQERKRHPEESEREIFLRVAVRRLGKELTEQVYGNVPHE